MATFPLDLIPLLGKFWAYLVYGVIGFGFGYALEISGFGNSKKLAAQFYFKDLTVLKVMFTAIVVAMVLIFAASGLGLLDYNLVWVNPTYLWPGIVGGLIMGVGFIVGGFCPGTSLVAMATRKIDGLFFVLGGLFGIFVFGEMVDYFCHLLALVLLRAPDPDGCVQPAYGCGGGAGGADGAVHVLGRRAAGAHLRQARPEERAEAAHMPPPRRCWWARWR